MMKRIPEVTAMSAYASEIGQPESLTAQQLIAGDRSLRAYARSRRWEQPYSVDNLIDAYEQALKDLEGYRGTRQQAWGCWMERVANEKRQQIEAEMEQGGYISKERLKRMSVAEFTRLIND